MNVTSLSDQRCLASEAKAQEALDVIKTRGAIKGLKTPPIVEVIHKERHSWHDNKGVDFMAIAEGGLELPLQIKSSERGKKKFERRQRYHLSEGKRVFVSEALVVDPDAPLETVISAMIGYLNRVYNFVRRMAEKAVCHARHKLQLVTGKKHRGQSHVATHQMCAHPAFAC